MKNFSIVNGAQTTSALGQYLKVARRNRDKAAEDRLKLVHVLARVLKVPDEDTENNIAIYNNTQNPITSRDMVANRPEQKKLNELFLDDNYPQIYMEIRNGATIPSDFNKKYVHRKTTNEELAQIAYSSFLQQPFTAKDKKASLFSNDYSQSAYTLNSIYHNIFNYDSDNIANCGVLFRKTKTEIDEALFTKQLYVECKKYLKGIYQQRLDKELSNLEKETDDSKKKAIQNRVDTYAGRLETVGICMFYFIDLYYEFLDQFGTAYAGKRYDFDKFYSDKEYRNEIVKECATLFLEKVINLLIDTAKAKSKANNLNNWVRSQTCQTEFQSKLQNDIAANLSWQDEYADFMDKYKKIDI